MKAKKEDSRRSTIYGCVQQKKKGAIKTCRRVLLILVLVCTLPLDAISASFAATTCGAPDSCVVVVDNYRLMRDPTQEKTMTTITGLDHSCSYLSSDLNSIRIPIGAPYYYHTTIKYYWDGSNWKPLSLGPNLTYYVGGGFSINPDIGADYANDWDGKTSRWVTANQVFPNGCSDLPKPTPDNTPNPDTGSPECGSQAPLD